MTALTIGLLVIAGIGFGFLISFLLRRNSKVDGTGLNLLINQVNDLRNTIDTKLGESDKSMRENLMHQSRNSQEIIRDITERLTRLDETNKQVISFTEQLQSLQDILKNPKQRGILGEYYLETLLKNALPPESFEMQYKFADGEIVDAIVRIKDQIIPIDSKFSLENYNRIIETNDQQEKDRLEKVFIGDLKNRIMETAKYIRPDEGTMDFAFMFIPHEAIYYDLLINKIGAIQGEDTENLIQRAAGKYKVIIVSPTSFLAYLQTVLQGLRALKIEESAKDIIKRVGELGKHWKGYEEYHAKLGASLGTAINHFNASNKELKKVDKDVMRIAGNGIDIESIALDKPESE